MTALAPARSSRTAIAPLPGDNAAPFDTATGRQRRITRDGSGTILNGILDWVYQEEIYGRGRWRGYWWSPEGAHVAYLRLDEEGVDTFTVVIRNRGWIPAIIPFVFRTTGTAGIWGGSSCRSMKTARRSLKLSVS